MIKALLGICVVTVMLAMTGCGSDKTSQKESPVDTIDVKPIEVETIEVENVETETILYEDVTTYWD